MKHEGAKNKKTKVARTGDNILTSYGIICALLWLALIVAKLTGKVTWSWIVVVLSVFLIAVVVAVLFFVAATAMIAFGRSMKRIAEWKRRRKIARKLWESMEGLTLNNVGPIYGVRRQPGEKNKEYKRRILKAARTLDVVNVQNVPAPATGQKLDAIAAKHGLRRGEKETDAQLQERIRAQVLKNLEGGNDHGVQNRG